jgi:hypothetical protein
VLRSKNVEPCAPSTLIDRIVDPYGGIDLDDLRKAITQQGLDFGRREPNRLARQLRDDSEMAESRASGGRI